MVCQVGFGNDAGPDGVPEGHWSDDPAERSARLHRMTGSKFTRIDVNAGLASGFIHDIDQDDQGFIWMGTPNGLDRFDGYSVRNYRHNPNAENSLGSNGIRTLVTASNGIIWAGSRSAGVDRLDSTTGEALSFRNLPGDPRDIGDDYVNEVITDRQGDIWVATKNAGLSRIDHQSFEVTRYHTGAIGAHRISDDSIRTVFAAQDGRIFAGTDSGLIYKDVANPDFQRADLGEAGNDGTLIVSQMQQASDGSIYLKSDTEGILRMSSRRDSDGSGNETFSFLPLIGMESLPSPEFLHHLMIDSFDRLWILAGEIHLIYDTVIEEFTSFVLLDGVSRIFEDNTGIIWIYSDNGLFRMNPDHLAFGDLLVEMSALTEQSLSHVFAILESRDGSILMSGPQGIWRYAHGTGEILHFAAQVPKDSPTDDTNALFEDKDGLIWAGTYSAGINRINPSSGAIENYLLCDPAPVMALCNRVWVIKSDAAGKMWVGSAENLLFFDAESNTFLPFSVTDEAVSAKIASGVRALETGRNNTLWIGTEKGLLRWQPETNEWQSFVRDDVLGSGLSSNFINSLHEDDEGVLWVGTALGAHRLEPNTGRIDRINTATGMPNDDIQAVIQDANGTIWMSTGEGLVSLDKANNELKIYKTEDGLTNDEFLTGSAYAARSGKIYFGGLNSVVYFDPDSLAANPIPPQIALTQLIVNNEPVTPNRSDPAAVLKTSINMTDSIVLPQHRANISVEFAALHYADPAKNRYAYRLAGFEDDWIYTDSSHRRASYTNLPFGEYTLRIKAANKDGVWNKDGRSLAITILTPFWRTWWAYLLYGVALVMAIMLVVQLRTRALTSRAQHLEQLVSERTRQIQENEQLIQNQAENLEQLLHLKEKLFTNISHEFRTPLTLILGPVNRMLKSDITNEQASRLQLVKQNSQRLLRLVDQLLALSRLEAEEPIERTAQPLSKICGAIGETFASLARTREITFEVQVDENLWVNASVDALEKILMNLLSNAFKYTPKGGLVSMNLGLRGGEQVELSVSDSGVGISPERQESVFDRFNRVVDASESVPGAGIGLSLVKELIEDLDGSIDLGSVLGEGTSMVVKLPSVEAPLSTREDYPDIVLSDSVSMELDNLSRSGYVTSETRDGDEEQNPTILVIEDNPDMQQYLVELLSPRYACLVAGDGQMGTELGLDQVPDLVLCDVMLPKRDGYKVSQILKSDERSSHIPIIMLTARGDQDSRLRGLREKVDDYIAKPFDDDELLLRIENILDARETLRNKYAKGLFDDADPGQGLGQRDQAFLAKLEAVSENHLSDPNFRIEVLTSQMAMSERNLQRKLKALTSRTPGQYLRTQRMKKAKVLLRDQVPVNLVAERVGFSSPAYFSSCFREEFDQSPSEFSQYKGSDPTI